MLHWKLSFSHPLQPMMKILSKWRHFWSSECSCLHACHLFTTLCDSILANGCSDLTLAYSPVVLWAYWAVIHLNFDCGYKGCHAALLHCIIISIYGKVLIWVNCKGMSPAIAWFRQGFRPTLLLIIYVLGALQSWVILQFFNDWYLLFVWLYPQEARQVLYMTWMYYKNKGQIDTFYYYLWNILNTIKYI